MARERRYLSVAGFDYSTEARGAWARLQNGNGQEVVLTDFPTTLLSMLKAGVLTGRAKADAEALRQTNLTQLGSSD